jgi:hypothetical protein
MPRFHITDLDPADEPAIHHIAEILVAGFKRHWPRAWPDLASALEEVRESFGEGRLSRVARDAGGQVLGWIGGIPPLCHCERSEAISIFSRPPPTAQPPSPAEPFLWPSVF